MSSKKVIRGSVYLAVMALVIFLLRDSLWEVLSSADRISEVPWWAWVLMLIFESASFACVWWMFKLVLPDTSWGVIAKSQLISNASSRVIPGGAATGGAVQFRVLTASGVEGSAAGGSLAATSILTFMGLFAIPSLAGIVAILEAPLERDLAWGAIGGGILLVGTFVLGFALVKLDGPLNSVNRLVDYIGERVSRARDKDWQTQPSRLLDERRRIMDSLAGKWPSVAASAIGKWLLDFGVLYVVIRAVSDEIEFEFAILLLAYAAASTLVMIPVTPGGFGIVEVGLTSLLISAGVLESPANLAVFAYRLLSFWFPILVGLVALAFGNTKYLSEKSAAEPV